MNAFYRLAPFIQDFIYYNNWTELREIQVAAIEAILDSDSNLLLSSGTASGKTEAAFLPVLTDLYENPSSTVGVLYISPLKALINDQFIRLESLIEQENIPVCKWHGDASQSKKKALLKNPKGILQITPESLESMLMNKKGTCLKLFGDLRYVIIDEMHHFMRNARGIQVLALLQRIQDITGKQARRIGLSATLGNIEVAKNWLNMGTKLECIAPVAPEDKKRIKLFVERFVKHSQKDGDSENLGDSMHYEYLFKMSLNQKTIVFTNSREETELVMSNLRQIAVKNKAPDVYRVHHGNVSSVLREQTEDEMKTSSDKIVTGATVTLELGIDIGSLDQVIQVGAPISVSSFAQRLGRCGRRGQIPQLLFTFTEEVQTTAADILGPINWGFLRLIAIIELYTKRKWIEPLTEINYPYSILYHQTMGVLKSSGELSPAKLASDVLSLKCFKSISQTDFKILLRHLLDIHHIQETDEGGLIIGRIGERVANHFSFYTVFTVPEYYLVKDENRSIGTVDKIYPVGMHFSLAGMTWETVEVNEKAKVLFVKKITGISVVDWDVDFSSELHSVLVKKIREVLKSEQVHPYLSTNCKERLDEIRYVAQNSGFCDNLVTPLSLNKYAIFPWVGTRQLFTLHFILKSQGINSRIPWETCIYLEVNFKGAIGELEAIVENAIRENVNLHNLNLPDKIQIENKYNEYIPEILLRKQYVEDFLDLEGLQKDYEF